MSKGTSNAAFNLKGRGILGSFISEPLVTEEEQTGIKEEPTQDIGAQWIPIDRIQKGRFQPRQFFSQESIDSLSRSFKEQGFRGAINVRPSSHGSYELVAGERRWRAAKQAGLDKVRCIVDEYSDEEALEFGLIENLQREDLSKLEETEGILQLIEVKFGIPRDQTITIIRTEGHSDKRNRSDVAPSEKLQQIETVLSHFNIEIQTFRTKNLRTLSLPEELKKAHLEQNLAYSSALELSKLKNESERKELLEETLAKGLSFRDIKERVQTIAKIGSVQEEEGKESYSMLVHRLEVTAKQAKKTGHLFEKAQKRKKLERLLSELEELLREE